MKQLILSFLLLSALTSISQHTDTVLWRESYRLTWDDFKGPPQDGPGEGAITNAILTYDAKNTGTFVTCNVICYFNRPGSWVRPNSKLDYVLRHEQTHFDLQEVYARKLRKKFLEHTFKWKTFNQEGRKMFDKISKEVIAMHKKYDKATGLAFNEANQKKWTKKITEQLRELEQYKNAPLTLKVKT